MEEIKVFRTCQGAANLLLPKVWIARTFWQRLRGLLLREPLSDQQGLLIAACKHIHTTGMSYPLDVIFIDQHGAVVRIVKALSPNRQASARSARSVLELTAGMADKLELKCGEQLIW